MAEDKQLLRNIFSTVVKASKLTGGAPFLGVGVINKVLDEDEAVTGLIQLVQRKFLPKAALDMTGLPNLSAEDLAKSPDKLKGIFEIIENAIGNAQAKSGVDLDQDEILGPKTYRWLTTKDACDGKLKRATSSNAQPLSDTAKHEKTTELRYRIKGELPTASTFDTASALVECFSNWRDVCGLIFTDVTKSNPDEANVEIFVADIDHGTPTVADAHVGPPSSNFLLELRIDDSVSWDKHKFVAGISHEIGHLLGLDHTNIPNQLMNPTIGAVEKPQKEYDIAKVTSSSLPWGPSKLQDAAPREVG